MQNMMTIDGKHIIYFACCYVTNPKYLGRAWDTDWIVVQCGAHRAVCHSDSKSMTEPSLCELAFATTAKRKRLLTSVRLALYIHILCSVLDSVNDSSADIHTFTFLGTFWPYIRHKHSLWHGTLSRSMRGLFRLAPNNLWHSNMQNRLCVSHQ